MKPLALVAGFLGSGKTTLLRGILEQNRHRRLLFLINEFAADEVDATLLTEAGGVTRAVAGGSVFCNCRADAFKDVLIEAAAMPELDGVVVEASGMAEPRAMGRILSDPRLADAYTVTALVAVVDPLTFPKLRYTLPATEGQVSGADLVIINKTDLASPPTVAKLHKELGELNPEARICETVYSKCDFDPVIPLRKGGLGTETPLTNAGDRSFASLLVRQKAPVDLGELQNALQDLSGMVFRVKGWLVTPDKGRLFVEQDVPGHDVRHSAASEGPGRLAIIVKANARQAAENRLSRISGLSFSE